MRAPARALAQGIALEAAEALLEPAVALLGEKLVADGGAFLGGSGPRPRERDTKNQTRFERPLAGRPKRERRGTCMLGLALAEGATR